MSAPMTADLAAFRAAQQRFAHGDHTLAYWEDGAGEPLLLIHGFPTASWDWAPIWPALAQRFRLVAMDMLGFGFSSKPRPYVYSISEQADLYEALLAKLGIARCHVLAHDYGDTVAQELLARFEDRRASGAPGLALRSVCFLNGGLFPESHHPRPVQVALAGPDGEKISAALDETLFTRGFGEVFGPRTQPSAARTASAGSARCSRARSRCASSTVRRTPSRARTSRRATASWCPGPTSYCCPASATTRRSRIRRACCARSSRSTTNACADVYGSPPCSRRRASVAQAASSVSCGVWNSARSSFSSSRTDSRARLSNCASSERIPASSRQALSS